MTLTIIFIIIPLILLIIVLSKLHTSIHSTGKDTTLPRSLVKETIRQMKKERDSNRLVYGICYFIQTDYKLDRTLVKSYIKQLRHFANIWSSTSCNIDTTQGYWFGTSSAEVVINNGSTTNWYNIRIEFLEYVLTKLPK